MARTHSADTVLDGDSSIDGQASVNRPARESVHARIANG